MVVQHRHVLEKTHFESAKNDQKKLLRCWIKGYVVQNKNALSRRVTAARSNGTGLGVDSNTSQERSNSCSNSI